MSDNTLIPNTYQKPNVYSDLYDYYLTPTESKLLDFFVRRILGFDKHRETLTDRISLSQICNGIQKADGTWITRGPGLSRPEAVETIASLVKFGFIVRVGEPTRHGQEYALVLDDTKIDLAALKARKEAAKEAGRKRTKKARLVRHTNTDAVSLTNQQLDGHTATGKPDIPLLVSQTNTQNPGQNPGQNPRVSDETRPPALEEPGKESVAPPAAPAPRKEPTWDDIEAAPPEARTGPRRWRNTHDDWYDGLIRVTTGWTRMEFEAKKGERIRKRYHADAKRMREEDGRDIADLIGHYDRGFWWWSATWKGRDKNEWPTVDDIDKTWGDWERAAPPPANGSTEDESDYQKRVAAALAREREAARNDPLTQLYPAKRQALARRTA